MTSEGLISTEQSAKEVVAGLLKADARRWYLLGVVAELGLPDCWIGAGFIRDAVWDHLHSFVPSPPHGDVDVIWFDRSHPEAHYDLAHEAALRLIEPAITWSVKNQARMHARNGDAPYHSTADAMQCWPETCTAIAARRNANGTCEIAAPLGCRDLFDLVLRPSGRFATDKYGIFENRVTTKGWLNRWPKLKLA